MSKSYSRKKCKSRSISRRSYKYIKKSTGKEVKVRASCVKSRSLRSRGINPRKVLPTLKGGSLTQYGYKVHESSSARHEALKKALEAYGYSRLIKKLNAVRLLNENAQPKNAKIYDSDMKYVRKLAGKKSPPRRSMRKSRRRRRSVRRS